jgi:hypothetical protein
LRRAWLLATLLVVFGNAMPPLIGGTARLPGGSWAFIVAGALLIGISLAIARDAGLDRRALGLVGSLRYSLLGAGVGAAIALVAVLAIPLVAAITGRPLTYEPLRGLRADVLAGHVAFFPPLGDILPEEIAFRAALVGGAAFAELRLRTGTIVTTVAAHWAFNTVVLLGFWSQMPARSPAP